jgi:nanoRNase/pAp phosphatase (c-di-AMP/oligoRNAs hydrolase)
LPLQHEGTTPMAGDRRSPPVSDGTRIRRDDRRDGSDGHPPARSPNGHRGPRGAIEDPAEAVRRLVALARDRTLALVLTHDNPDPDAMASAAGLALLLETAAGIPSRLAYGGIIGRAENRELVRLLKLPMNPLSRLEVTDYDLLALLDTQPAAGNHSLPRHRALDVVVDHHPLRPGSTDAAVCMVSNRYGATSSIVTGLLRAAGIEPSATLATALFYGVKSDTRGLGRESIRADADAYAWLFPRSDQSLLTQIEHPQVPRSYFGAYHTAFERARTYDSVIQVDLGEVYTPDIVPEIAERLLSLENVKWSVALGDYEGALYVSIRTNDRRMNAGRHIQALTQDLGGSAGGHGSMAGARIPLDDRSLTEARNLRSEILERFRTTLGVDRAEGRPII